MQLFDFCLASYRFTFMNHGVLLKCTCLHFKHLWKVNEFLYRNMLLITRFEIVLISYKDQIWFHTLHTRMKSMFSFINDQRMKSKNSYMIPSWNVRIHHKNVYALSTKWKNSYTIRVRNLYEAAMSIKPQGCNQRKYIFIYIYIYIYIYKRRLDNVILQKMFRPRSSEFLT